MPTDAQPFGPLSSLEGEKRFRAFIREIVSVGGRGALLAIIEQEAHLAGRRTYGDGLHQQTFLFP